MAIARSYKNPPELNEEKKYETWKNELKLWQLVTDLDKTKQGPVVALSLEGKYREVAMELTATELNAEGGLDALLTKLDDAFKMDSALEAFEMYAKFESLQREPNKSIGDFIIEFERSYNLAEKHGMKLNDSVKAYKVLVAANLTQQEKQLVLSNATKLEYKLIKTSLKHIFGSATPENSVDRKLIFVKEEPALVTAYGLFRGRGRFNYQRSFHNNGQRPRDGTPRCFRCNSAEHFIKDCPENKQSNTSVNVTLSEQTGPEESKNAGVLADTISRLAVECAGKAIVDTACTATVCGYDWLEDFIEMPPEKRPQRDRRSLV